ncbi:MAG TPA: hypothetical protein VI385_09140 [Flavisolibacter sp.]
MNTRKTGVFLLLGLALVGCKDKDKAYNGTKFDQVYFDYAVTAEEGDEDATCVFQYKYGGEEGRAMNIEPAKVELDGKAVESDSAKLSGFFYEVQRPIDSFAGKHLVAFITPDGKEYRNEFDFTPFTIEGDLPERVKKKPFTIQLHNFPPGEKQVRLLLLDTAFESRGFNDLVPVLNGKVNINSEVLTTVKKGPVVLQLYSEQENPLKQKTLVGGKISISYGLKRQFELVQ